VQILNDPIVPSEPWWRNAVCYQIYVRSFADSNGDGVGDLPGVTSRLPYLRRLGVDAIWLTPFYTSPQHDHGYDVADYRDVDPLFGTLADADDLISAAHEAGLKIMVDIVPNHTSSEHAWFQEALASPPGSAARERYLFRDGRGPDGDLPPNNWKSVMGGVGWTRITEADGSLGQWYLHLFDTSQPDLNWRNPEIGDMFEDVLRFWLDRGVDGFRIDVAHSLFKAEGLPEDERTADERIPTTFSEDGALLDVGFDQGPMWDQPEVHDVYRRWHKILAEYDGDRMTVAEAWTHTRESMARYIRDDELSQSFNFAWLEAQWSADAFRRVITDTFAALDPVGAAPTWVLSNHDVVRHTTRYGGGLRGLARARAATLTMLALPGSSYLYQGEELGLEQVEVAPEHRQDPVWFRSGEAGRDGCRVPLPWAGDAPPYDFGGTPWIPQPTDWADLSVEAQDLDPDSTLNFYRQALEQRRTLQGDQTEFVPLGEEVVAFTRGSMLAVLNCGSSAVPLPAGEVVICSDPNPRRDGFLAPDTAVWLRV
jgi:alpha-glucosidase